VPEAVSHELREGEEYAAEKSYELKEDTSRRAEQIAHETKGELAKLPEKLSRKAEEYGMTTDNLREKAYQAQEELQKVPEKIKTKAEEADVTKLVEQGKEVLKEKVNEGIKKAMEVGPTATVKVKDFAEDIRTHPEYRQELKQSITTTSKSLLSKIAQGFMNLANVTSEKQSEKAEGGKKEEEGVLSKIKNKIPFIGQPIDLKSQEESIKELVKSTLPTVEHVEKLEKVEKLIVETKQEEPFSGTDMKNIEVIPPKPQEKKSTFQSLDIISPSSLMPGSDGFTS
jgi:hypothetical protein